MLQVTTSRTIDYLVKIIRFENLLSSYLEVDRVKVDDKKLENLLNVHIELIDDPFLNNLIANSQIL